MKKIICLLLAILMLTGLVACGETKPEPASETETAPAAEALEETAVWTRIGYFSDENDNMLYILESEEDQGEGWIVGVIMGETMTGSVIAQEGSTLHGDLNAWDENADPFIVTVSEEGEEGLLLQVEDGETYHFLPLDIPEATIFISVNSEGLGNVAYAEGETEPETDVPFQSAQFNLAEPTAYTFVAWPKTGNLFVKWMKDGEDFSTDPKITLELDQSTDLVAVFEEDPDWQNPVMNFVGEYQCDRAHARVECMGYDEASITIEWGSSAWELARWLVVGPLDTDTMTIEYSGCPKYIVVHDENGEVKSEEAEYEDGTGTIVFHEDGSFTWHEDKAEDRDDMLFQWVPTEGNEG